MNFRSNVYILVAAAYAGLGVLLVVLLHFSLSLLLIFLVVYLAGAYWGFRYILLMPVREFQRTLRAIADGDTELRVDLERSRALRPLGELVNMVAEAMNSDLLRMKKLERMRSEFLGNVSHELRTPIFSIQGMIETLLGGAVDDETVNREFLRRALANTERLNRLLEDLIDISRVETGELKLKFRFFNVSALVESVAEDMAEKAARRRITLSWSATESHLEAYGDKERLRQVLVNLVDNALKYSGEETVVTVAAVGKKDWVEITVADTGVGIAPEHLSRIFERFYRIDRGRSREEGGTGLGLAIAKHIVEAHHSTITVTSEPGKGTMFQFGIPSPLTTRLPEPRERSMSA